MKIWSAFDLWFMVFQQKEGQIDNHHCGANHWPNATKSPHLYAMVMII